jgi:glycosyltransferase involved in cell wall biosynthesis
LHCPGKRILIYHNITPAECLEPYNEHLAEVCRQGRHALPALAHAVDLALADSPYNCRELAEQGFRNPKVLPILCDWKQWDAVPADARTLDRYGDDWINFLFVGRLSPNKCQDDVIRAFADYNRRIDRRSRLMLVGSWRYMERYWEELWAVARSHGVEDHVFVPGHVRPEELISYYRLADVFLCLSEHEGFCVPLLEAMHHEVPILAYAATAVPDTLGPVGLLVRRKDFSALAELAHLLICDADLRNQVVRRQRQRLADFRPEAIAGQFRSYLDELM